MRQGREGQSGGGGEKAEEERERGVTEESQERGEGQKTRILRMEE